MIKVKFRVYVEKQCRKCRKVHLQPTHRTIYHQADGEEFDVIQEGHALAVAMLEQESKKQRPLYQYSFEV